MSVDLLRTVSQDLGRKQAINAVLDWLSPLVYQWKSREFDITPEEFRQFLQRLIATLSTAGNGNGSDF